MFCFLIKNNFQGRKEITMIINTQSKRGNTFRAAIISTGIVFTTVCAVTHTVQFGGSLALTYSPKSFTANVGDTVKWAGDFAMHPLSSTTIPSSAAAWHQGSGSSPFIYAIKVAGTYDYKCDTHVSSGMVGSFTVTSASSIGTNQTITKTEPLMLQTFSISNTLFLSIQCSHPEIVSVKLFDALGKELISIPHLYSGVGTRPIAFQKVNKGIYFLKVYSREETMTRVISTY
jgi:plastocyanin